MENNEGQIFRGIPLSAIAYAREILDPLKSKEATTKINALFNYIKPHLKLDLTKHADIAKFLSLCVTRDIVDRLKSNNGTEETDEEYKARIADEQYNTAKVTTNIRFGLDENEKVHFYVKFGEKLEKECELSTEDTITLVLQIYDQFIINIDDQEKQALEYVLGQSEIRKVRKEEEKEKKIEKEIVDLKHNLQEIEEKNKKLHQDFVESQQNAMATKESKEKIEKELQENAEEMMKINTLLEQKKKEEEELREENSRLKDELEKEKQKSPPKEEQTPQGNSAFYDENKEDIDRIVILAAQNGDWETIEAVVQVHGAQCLLAKDRDGFTALQWAEKNDHYETAEKISELRKIARKEYNLQVPKKEVALDEEGKQNPPFEKKVMRKGKPRDFREDLAKEFEGFDANYGDINQVYKSLISYDNDTRNEINLIHKKQNNNGLKGCSICGVEIESSLVYTNPQCTHSYCLYCYQERGLGELKLNFCFMKQCPSALVMAEAKTFFDKC